MPRVFDCEITLRHRDLEAKAKASRCGGARPLPRNSETEEYRVTVWVCLGSGEPFTQYVSTQANGLWMMCFAFSIIICNSLESTCTGYCFHKYLSQGRTPKHLGGPLLVGRHSKTWNPTRADPGATGSVCSTFPHGAARQEATAVLRDRPISANTLCTCRKRSSGSHRLPWPSDRLWWRCHRCPP